MAIPLTFRLPAPSSAAVTSQCIVIFDEDSGDMLFGVFDRPVDANNRLFAIELEKGKLVRVEVSEKVNGAPNGVGCFQQVNTSDPRWCDPAIIDVFAQDAVCPDPDPVTPTGDCITIPATATVTCCGDSLRVEDDDCVIFYSIADADAKLDKASGAVIFARCCGDDICVPTGTFADGDALEECICSSSTVSPPPPSGGDLNQEILDKLCDIHDEFCCDVRAEDDLMGTTPDTPVTVDLLDNDGGVDIKIQDINGTPVTTGTIVTLPGGHTVENHGDGTVTVTPAAGFTGSIKFPYTICDVDGNTDTAEVCVPIVNPPPPTTLNASDDDFGTIGIGQSSTPINVGLNDDDPDNNPDVLTVTMIDGIPITPGSSIVMTNGHTASLAADGLTVTTTIPPGATPGDYSVPYTIMDSDGDTATANITYTVGTAIVLCINDTPLCIDSTLLCISP